MPTIAKQQTVFVFTAEALNWEERCTVETLQGLVNRSGPCLFLDNGQDWDIRWLQIYGARLGLVYERITSLNELLARFRKFTNGLVVYDPEVDGARYAAITWAGVENLLPVCPEVLSGSSPAFLGVGHPLTEETPVKQDLRGRFKTSKEACEWALSNLMPHCSRWLAHAVDGGKADGIVTGACGPMSGFDWQAMNKGFVFNLGASVKKVDAYGAMVGGNPTQPELYGRILDSMLKPAMVNGFGDPEDVWCKLLSKHNAFSFHAYRNWSFHHQVPAQPKPFRQKVNFTPQNTKPEPSKYYVCFMTSEGDTMKGPLPFFYDSWFDPARGKVPVNWGVNPMLARFFPAMLDYYYSNALVNDYFFAGCSGAGYCYPDVVPNLDKFTKHTAVACEESGITEVDIWGGNLPDTWTKYAVNVKPLGISVFAGPARIRITPNGTPVVSHELGYWQTHELEGGPWPTVFADDSKRKRAVDHLKDRIERIAARMRAPFIILVYGDLHSYSRHASLYKEVADSLDPERFKPSRLDEAMSAIRAWASDRVLIGTESINEPLQFAALSNTTTTIPIQLTNGAPIAKSIDLAINAPGVDRESKLTLKPREARAVGILTCKPGQICEGPVKAVINGERLTGEIFCIPGGNEASAVTFSGLWFTETLNHPAGKIIEDLKGCLNRVTASPEMEGKTECLVCGPYAARTAGHYAAAFRVKVNGAKRAGTGGADKAITLEMSSGGWSGTGGILAERSLEVGDLETNTEWQWLLLEGDWPGPPNQMELRIQWHGNLPVLFDRVALFQAAHK